MAILEDVCQPIDWIKCVWLFHVNLNFYLSYGPKLITQSNMCVSVYLYTYIYTTYNMYI